eukprot:TRINITY_DN113928_c0_g1_i1.p1 TRINITY_DN113928_c0_g1~~TRINITY_DN113928_c0_g1_i1.p1  ORF type:complete len:427 (+),score=81.50 TRINITY_DN113928_c0_g1_i1:69-1283(+)
MSSCWLLMMRIRCLRTLGRLPAGLLAACVLGLLGVPVDCSASCDEAEGGSCKNPAAGLGTAAPDFFRSYGTAWVQAEMLQDEVRTKAYRDAIMQNRELFAGKVVLDVGTGTGILALFAAQAGAKKVYAVERSQMAHVARQIAVDNKLDGVVEVIHGLLEDVQLPVDSVDIIISEWIGTFLIHESMIDSVIYARDRWLSPEGLILPDRATLYIAGVEDQGADFAAWEDFYGLNFSALSAASRRVAAQQCAYRRSLATLPAQLLDLNLYTTSVAEQEFARRITLRPSEPKTDAAAASGMKRPGEGEVAALAAWFTLDFFNVSSQRCAACSRAIVSQMTSDPDSPCTHWQQTMFHFKEPWAFSAERRSLEGDLSVRRAPGAPRDLQVDIRLESVGWEDSFFIVGADM